jgi:glc operon protein GlcG
LTLEDAQKVLAAGIATAEEEGVAVAIAVVDARGDLVLAGRMQGAGFTSADIAKGKAQAAALFGVPSSQYQPMAGEPIMQQVNAVAGGTLVFFQGGVPVVCDGAVVGGVGASGTASRPDADEKAAQAGADVLAA